jgi:hypothetical protein
MKAQREAIIFMKINVVTRNLREMRWVEQEIKLLKIGKLLSRRAALGRR